MKNIYNLITDAFARIGEDETKYFINVEYTEFTLRSYGVTITSRDHSVVGTASIVLLLNSELLDYYETNDLFNDESWERFCDVFEWQI
jgi:hypothetical protein